MWMRTAWVLAAGLASIGADDLPDYDERTLEIVDLEPVALTVNDQPATLLVRPDAASVPSINGSAATRFDFKPSMIAMRYRIGGETLDLRSDVARYDMGSGRFRRRSAFNDYDYTPGVDGTVGPGGLPFARALFRLRAQAAGEKAYVFPMDTMGRRSVGTQTMLGAHEMHVIFSLSQRESVLTATAGSLVSRAYNGHFSGEMRLLPIGYSVARPVRPLTLQESMYLGDLELRNLVVRTQDFGDASDIAEDAIEPDPNEIVVTAETDKDDLPWLIMTVGLDTIGHCSSLTYDFEEETVTLMCPDQA